MEEEHYEDAEEEMQEDQPGTDDDNDVVIVGKENHHMARYSMLLENRLFTYIKILYNIHANFSFFLCFFLLHFTQCSFSKLTFIIYKS